MSNDHPAYPAFLGYCAAEALYQRTNDKRIQMNDEPLATYDSSTGTLIKESEEATIGCSVSQVALEDAFHAIKAPTYLLVVSFDDYDDARDLCNDRLGRVSVMVGENYPRGQWALQMFNADGELLRSYRNPGIYG